MGDKNETWTLTVSLISSWIYSRCWMVKQIRRNTKTSISFSKKELRTVASKPSFTLIKMKRTTFFTNEKLFEKERYLNLHNFNNRNTMTKIRLSSHNFAINTTKWYNLQDEMKICKNCDKKEIEDEIHIIFSYNKYDNIWRKAFNDINEVDNIKLQVGKKVEKLKLFFAKSSLKDIYIYGIYIYILYIL